MAAANKRKFNPPQAETSNGRSKYHSLYINSDSLHNKRSPPQKNKIKIKIKMNTELGRHSRVKDHHLCLGKTF